MTLDKIDRENLDN